jgi:two-component system sensor kinase FixL
MSLIPKAGEQSKYTATYGQTPRSIEFIDHQRHRNAPGFSHCESALLNAPAMENTMDGILLAMPEAVLVASLAGIIRAMNSQAEELLGYRSTDLAGQTISTVFTGELDPGPLSKLFDPGRWHTLTEGPSPVIRNRTGDVLVTEVTRCDLIVSGAPVCAYRMTDASEILRLRNRIAEAERETALLSRLAILGELTAAIAHELSQPLTAISSYIAAARNCFVNTADERPKHSLELMSKAGAQAQRAWQIVQRLRTLLQNRSVIHRESDLRQAVQDAIELATLGVEIDGFHIVKKIPDTPVLVKMDAVQIQILLANLIRNAIDELRVSTGRRIITIELKANDFAAEVSVADTGPGIAQHVQDSMFNPFLTTKPEGLGVGLAVSRRIAMAHGGRLEARNLEEGGAEFSFIIPVSVKKRVDNE